MAMVLVVSEIKEIKPPGEAKHYIYRLVLDTQKPENSNYKASILEFASLIRFKDIEPGDLFNIRRTPYGLPVNGKTSEKLKSRIKDKESADIPT